MATIQLDRALGNFIEARSHCQDRRFAATRMTDQRDKLALVDLQIKVLNHGQRPLGRGVDLVQHGEIQEPVLDHALLGVRDRSGHAVDWGHIGQLAGAFHLGLDAHIHQVLGHIRAQAFERVIVVHFHPVPGAGDGHFELFAQGPVGVQGNDAVGQNDGLVHVIGDQHTGLFVSFPNALDFVGQIGAGQRVQRRQRLIQQQHLGVHRQGAGHIHPLAHAPRQLGGTTPRCMGQADHANVMGDLLGPLGLGQLGEHRIDGEAHIAAHGQPGHQRVALENHATFGTGTCDGRALETGRAAGGCVEARQQVDQGRLARPGKAQKHKEFALLHIQRDPVQHIHTVRAGAKAFGDIVEFEKAHITHRLFEKVNMDWIAYISRSSRKPMMPMVKTATMILASDCDDPFWNSSQTNLPNPGFWASISAAIRTIQPTPSDRRNPVKIKGRDEGRTNLVILVQVFIFRTLETLTRSLSMLATPRAVLINVGHSEQSVTVMAEVKNDLAKNPSEA
mmetsp:Transcript_13743/g.23394  ORF Transcript_13743/g.23394 Transcript_13743/m.23394 type:complete len:505 (-) Transcript_13743:846-2360(-)